MVRVYLVFLLIKADGIWDSVRVGVEVSYLISCSGYHHPCFILSNPQSTIYLCIYY